MSLKSLLPEFPTTPHFHENQQLSFENEIYVEEKIDGANCGMSLIGGEAVIRNRSHILRKGYVKNTAAKKQFASVWNWFYANKEKFKKLEGYSIYGEWMLALHGIRYDKLSSYFIAYDLFDHDKKDFLATPIAREILSDAKFDIVPLIHKGIVRDYNQLVSFCEELSQYSSVDKREGIYIKVCNNNNVLERYKVVRANYVQGAFWNEKTLTKNKLI